MFTEGSLRHAPRDALDRLVDGVGLYGPSLQPRF